MTNKRMFGYDANLNRLNRLNQTYNTNSNSNVTKLMFLTLDLLK